jgi:hypothetical protein
VNARILMLLSRFPHNTALDFRDFIGSQFQSIIYGRCRMRFDSPSYRDATERTVVYFLFWLRPFQAWRQGLEEPLSNCPPSKALNTGRPRQENMRPPLALCANRVGAAIVRSNSAAAEGGGRNNGVGE